MMKVPYTLVIGEKEVADRMLSPRIRSDLAIEGHQVGSYDAEQFFTSLHNEVRGRASKSSL